MIYILAVFVFLILVWACTPVTQQILHIEDFWGAFFLTLGIFLLVIGLSRLL